MELFSPNGPYAPTMPLYFSPTGMFYNQLMMLVMASLSALMHVAFLMSIRKLCGVGARSAYFVLGAIATFGFSYSISVIGSFSLAFIGLKWDDCIIVWRIWGAIFIALVLSMNFLHFYLLLQRIACILFPLSVELILGRTVVLVCFFAVAVFYVVITVLCLTPLAGVAYVPEHGAYLLLDRLPYSLLIVRANNFTNYAAMLSSAIVYPVLLLVLRLKLKSRNSKEEMRLTSQVALSVGIEAIFFFIWEFSHVQGVSEIMLFAVTNLWYYNAVTLPYFIMNKKIHNEIKQLFFRQNYTATVNVVGAKPQLITRTWRSVAC